MNGKKSTKVKKKSSRIIDIEEMPEESFFRRDVQIFPDLTPRETEVESIPNSQTSAEDETLNNTKSESSLPTAQPSVLESSHVLSESVPSPPPMVKQPSGRSKRHTRSGSVPRQRFFNATAQAITEAVRQKRAQKEDQTPIITQILSPDKRPLPPPDTTELLLNGIPLSRDVVTPIADLPRSTKIPVEVEEKQSSLNSVSPIPLPALEEEKEEDRSPPESPGVSIHPVPSVQEIPRTQHIPNKDNIPDYASMSPQEQYHHRSKFRVKYEIMRESWPQYKIPNFDDTVPLEYIHAQYREYVKHIHVRKSADKYKKYLIIFWAVSELICTKLGLNASSFAVAQVKAMDKYQTMLIELGEKDNEGVVESYTESWSVEVRLLWVSMINLVMFIVVKMLSDLLGEQMATNLVNMFTEQFSDTPTDKGDLNEVPKPDTGLDLGSLVGNFLPLLTGAKGTNSIPRPAHAKTGVKSRAPYDE